MSHQYFRGRKVATLTPQEKDDLLEFLVDRVIWDESPDDILAMKLRDLKLILRPSDGPFK